MKKRIYLVLLMLCLTVQLSMAVSVSDATALVKSGRYEQAITALQSLMQQPAYARDANCNKLLGQSLCMVGRYAEARPHLEVAIRSNRKSGALWYMAIVLQHLYEFDEAIEAIENYSSVLSSDDWLTRADSLMSECRICQRAFEHTQDVVVIDSMLVPRDNFFTYYKLGNESGRILSSTDGLYYESAQADYRIYSNGQGFEDSHRFQDKWDDAHPVAGIGADDCDIFAPFMRSDGVTLYFACDSTPGFGGYDIYRTTFDADDNTFYQPERLGMPFNSPFDDYMMAIDETHQVGWWATNRNAPADSVTIYLFLVEDETKYLDEPTISRARLDCIAETWRESGGYAQLLDEVFNASQTSEVSPQVRIIIGDGIVYTDAGQFRNAKARQAYEQSVSIDQRIADTEAQLSLLRIAYAQARGGQRQQLSAQILADEESLLSLYQLQRKAVLAYRSLETR